MRTILGPLVILGLASSLLVATPAVALDVVYVTRHAQKEEQKDTKKDRRKLSAWKEIDDGRLLPLTLKGATCAVGLAEHLAETKIAAVYSSETARTLSTAAAVSGNLEGVGIITYETTEVPSDQWVAELRECHQGDEAILIVGHSDTVGKLVLAFRKVDEACLQSVGLERGGIDVTQYGDLWAVDLNSDDSCPISRTRIKARGDQKIDCSSSG